MRLHASWKRFWDRAVRLCASPLCFVVLVLSPHEIGLRLSYINADGAARLIAKLATAVAALEEERQHTDES